MEKLNLPPRLLKIASFVRRGARLADVGTDHGYIPVWLSLNGICAAVSATDIRPGPLSRASASARDAGMEDKITFTLCDGLDGVGAFDPDSIIIAGMGGETIAGILARAPWTRENRQLILQPASKPEKLRRWLSGSGYVITEEHLVRDSGRIYPIILARGGEDMSNMSAAEFFIGHWDKIRNDPLFEEYLEIEIERMSRAVRGMEEAADPKNASRLNAAREVLSGFCEMKGRCDNAKG